MSKFQRDNTLEKIARDRLKKQRENAQKMELDAEAQYEIYRKEHGLMARKKQPAKVEDLQKAIMGSAYLKFLGLKTKALEDGFVVEMPAGEITSNWQGTTERSMASEEHPFITWGNRYVDGLLCVMSEKLEACKDYVRRISVPLAGGEAVGYLVATERDPVLVTSYEMLAHIKTAGRLLPEAAIESARAKLARMAAEEQKHYE